VGNARQGWAIFAVMMVLFVGGLALTVPQEHSSSVAMAAAGVPPSAQNLEGKEQRIGVDESSLWNVATTAASNGSVNSMHDSYRPLGALAAMFNMGIGEVVWGGVGSGLYGMLFYAVIAVFMGGLMVGRTPEYLGKKIGAREIKISAIAVLVPLVLVLAVTAVGVLIPGGLEGRANAGPHGFSEIFYAFLSQGNNNGSAFAGYTASGAYPAIAGGLLMIASRFVPLLAALALAGSLGRAGTVPATSGTLHTDTVLFVVLLTFVILVIGALTFLPGLAVGPIVDPQGRHGRTRLGRGPPAVRPAHRPPGDPGQPPEAAPADLAAEPGDLRGRGRLRRRDDPRRGGRGRRGPDRVRHGDRAGSLVHRALRELRGGAGGGAGQGAGRRAPQDARRPRRPAAHVSG
jgi:K+-transporting ATPase ATPase A chain